MNKKEEKMKQKLPAPTDMSWLALILELRSLYKDTPNGKPAYNGSQERAEELVDELKKRPTFGLW